MTEKQAGLYHEGPRYHRAAEAASHIVNLLAGDYPGGKAELYGRVIFVILAAMYQVDEDFGAWQPEPSQN